MILKLEFSRFLHSKFASLPAQAIPARLAGLRPPRGATKFSREGGKELLSIAGVMKYELSAQLRGISKNLVIVFFFFINLKAYFLIPPPLLT